MDIDFIISKPPHPYSGSSSSSLVQPAYRESTPQDSLSSTPEDESDASDTDVRAVGEQIRRLDMTPLPQSRFYYGQAR